MKKTITELRVLISALSSTKNMIKFLMSIYSPGYKEVIDLLIELGQKIPTEILAKEIAFAIKKSQPELVEKYGKMFTDIHLEEGLLILVPNYLKVWHQEVLNQYLLSQLPASEDLNDIFTAIRIYEKLGIVDDNLEKLEAKKLELCFRLSKVNSDALFSLTKSGKYNEAIDYVLSKNKLVNWDISQIWQIAKEHVPERKHEIAKTLWKRGVLEAGWELNFAEVALELNLHNKAKEQLKTWVKTRNCSSPRYYNELVKALILLNMGKELETILAKARSYVSEQKYPCDSYIEMGKLCIFAGKLDEVKTWFEKAIDYTVNEANPVNAPGIIKQYIELTGDSSMQVKKVEVFETQGLYLEASLVAEDFGMRGKATAFREMAQMLLPA